MKPKEVAEQDTPRRVSSLRDKHGGYNNPSIRFNDDEGEPTGPESRKRDGEGSVAFDNDHSVVQIRVPGNERPQDEGVPDGQRQNGILRNSPDRSEVSIKQGPQQPCGCACNQPTYGDESTVCSSLMEMWQSTTKKKRRACKLATFSFIIVFMVVIGLICFAQRGDILTSLDKSALPCEDFYAFACGGWKSRNPLPSSLEVWDTFSVNNERIHYKIKSLLEEPERLDEPAVIVSAKKFYKACTHQKSGILPLQKLVDQLGGLPAVEDSWSEENFDWLQQLARLRRDLGLNSIVSVLVKPDDKNVSLNIIYLNQGYVSRWVDVIAQNESATREWHIKVIEETFESMKGSSNSGILSKAIHNLEFGRYPEEEVEGKLPKSGSDPSSSRTPPKFLPDRDSSSFQIRKEAEDVWDFLVKVAQIMDLNQASRTAEELYNKMTIKEVTNLSNETTNNIDFLWFLKSVFSDVKLALDEDTEVVVNQVNFFKLLPKIMSEASPRVIANTLLFHVISSYGREVSLLGDEHSRWQDCTRKLSAFMSRAMAYLYIKVDKKESDEDVQEVSEMVAHLRELMVSTLKFSDWMDEDTREMAALKAREILPLVGYPDDVIESKKLQEFYKYLPEMSDTNHFENFMKLSSFRSNRSLFEVKKKPLRDRWLVDPLITNAFYSLDSNAILIPYGFASAPFFRSKTLPALIFGGIGSTVSHEIMHGFDTIGRERDWRGNLNNWWTNQSYSRFLKKTKCYETLYEQLPSSPQTEGQNMKVDGKRTNSENIADNEGLSLSWKVYKKEKLSEQRLIGLETFSSDQLFFIAYGQNSLKHGTHTPTPLRAMAVLRNHPEFAQAFGCKITSPMVSQNECSLWFKRYLTNVK